MILIISGNQTISSSYLKVIKKNQQAIVEKGKQSSRL